MPRQQRHLKKKEKDCGTRIKNAWKSLISTIEKIGKRLGQLGIFFTIAGGTITIIFTLIKYFGNSVSSVAKQLQDLAGKISRITKQLAPIIAFTETTLFHLLTWLS